MPITVDHQNLNMLQIYIQYGLKYYNYNVASAYEKVSNAFDWHVRDKENKNFIGLDMPKYDHNLYS